MQRGMVNQRRDAERLLNVPLEVPEKAGGEEKFYPSFRLEDLLRQVHP